MAISVRCPKCEKPSTVPDNAVGKTAKCPCGHRFVIANTAAPAEDVDALLQMAPIQNELPRPAATMPQSQQITRAPVAVRRQPAAPMPEQEKLAPQGDGRSHTGYGRRAPATANDDADDGIQFEFCPSCGAEWIPTATRCSACSWDARTKQRTRPGMRPMRRQEETGSGSGLKILLWMVGIIAVGAIVILVVIPRESLRAAFHDLTGSPKPTPSGDTAAEKVSKVDLPNKKEEQRLAAEKQHVEEARRKTEEETARKNEKDEQEKAKQREALEAKLFVECKKHILKNIQKFCWDKHTELSNLGYQASDRRDYNTATQLIQTGTLYLKAHGCNDPDEVKISKLLYKQYDTFTEVTARFDFSYSISLKDVIAKIEFDDPMQDGQWILKSFEFAQ